MTTSGLRAAARRIGLPAWFVTIDVVYGIFVPETLGVDARHYQRAAEAWLSGANPWAVTEYGFAYAAGPHTLLFYAPTSVLPLAVSVAAWLLVGLAASLWLLRRLELPLWWIAFPPLAHTLWNGNPHTIVVALLVFGGPLAAAVAVGIKLYAALPLVFRWRDLVSAGVLLLITIPVVPVALYLESGGNVGAHVESAWNGSAWRLPILIPAVLAALWLLRRRGAEWLAIPALWPATQFYYLSMALPALVGRPWLAAAFALPAPLVAPIAVVALAILEGRRRAATPEVGPGRPPGNEAPSQPVETHRSIVA